MILVDSSVWINQLAGRETFQTAALRQFVVSEQDIGLGDLVLAEVLQGTRDARAYAKARELLALFLPIQISDHSLADAAARNYRHLRSLGITVRKTIATLIATRCIVDNMPLLYSDRDFEPFVHHLGLRSAMAEASGVN